jgi:hexosaminidase
LKGLPPTPQRLLSLLDVIADSRFNAILVEWEDMFPWHVDERFRGPTAYTEDQVCAFADAAKKRGVELIPLVQILGHMETPLALDDYAHLREIDEYCDVINPLADGARELCEKMIDDVLELLPDTRYFHLGGDEAWSMGMHPQTKAFIAEQSKAALYLHHVQPLLERLNTRDIRPLIWHDMMLDWPEDELKRMGDLADLVVWGYEGTPDETSLHHATKHIEYFAKVGVPMWGAGVFKGASGADGDLPDIEPNAHNALGWADVAQRFDFKGLITTGWTRYDTLRVQCEPIDAALDSMMLHGVILHDGVLPKGSIDAVRAKLAGTPFESCHDAMANFAKLITEAWTAARELRQHVVILENDPRRRRSNVIVRLHSFLIEAIKKVEATTEPLKQTFDGLVDPMWIEKYVEERLIVLRDENETLLPRMQKLVICSSTHVADGG